VVFGNSSLRLGHSSLLPPGRGSLAMKPLPTGSATNTKTIGMTAAYNEQRTFYMTNATKLMMST